MAETNSKPKSINPTQLGFGKIYVTGMVQRVISKDQSKEGEKARFWNAAVVQVLGGEVWVTLREELHRMIQPDVFYQFTCDVNVGQNGVRFAASYAEQVYIQS